MKKWLPHHEEEPTAVPVLTKESPTDATPLPPCLDDSIVANLKSLGGEDDPEFFSTVVQQFLEDLPRHLENIQKAIHSQNAEALVKAAHTCKGSSGAIGAKALATISFDLELIGREGNMQDAASAFKQWRQEHDRTTTALCQQREKLTSLLTSQA